MNQELKYHLNETLKKGVRFDGRKLDDLRDVEVEIGFLSTAEGSARVKFGDCDVIAGVKLSLGTPYPDSPDEGVMMVNAEMLPLSNPEFETGPPSIDSIEISRVIDRGLRECGVIDTKKLCLKAGEKVWMVSIDVVPINFDGNLIDIGGFAALLALKDAKFPEYDEKEGVNYEKLTKKKLPLTNDDPIPITVCKIGENLVVDPIEQEENFLDARLTVTTTADDTLCSMQKGGDASLTIDEIKDMVELAMKKSKELRKHVKNG